MADVRDFSPVCDGPPVGTIPFPRHDLEAGLSPREDPNNNRATTPSNQSSKSSLKVPTAPSPILKRRQTRSNTVRTFDTIEEHRPNWRPGQEPGLDTSLPNGGRTHTPLLYEECQITVVDFSESDMVMYDFYTNKTFLAFLDKDQEPWVQCRWINVNGLSWDVIQALGNHKKLHRLAIEDLVNTNNRTKVDWYVDIFAVWLNVNFFLGIRIIPLWFSPCKN
jgi:Mg2+ and Co2+ transporter CorA